jgi:hypothetical protein
VWLACAIGVFFATSTFAQATSYRSVEAIPGKPVQLTYHASAQKNCSPAPPPMNSRYAASEGPCPDRPQGRADHRQGCGLSKDQGVGAGGFYQAREGYGGPDHISYEATNSDGEIGAFDVAITV